MKKIGQEKMYFIYMAVLLVFGVMIGIGTSIFFTESKNLSTLYSTGVGAIVALIIPVWQIYFVQKSKLTLEVNGISRKVSEKAKVSLEEHSELSYLRKIKEEDRPPFLISNGEPRKFHQDRSVSLDELEELIQRTRQQLKDAPEKIAERKNDLEKINSFTKETFTKHECNKLNRMMHPRIEYNDEKADEALDQFKQHFLDRFTEMKDKYDELQTSMPAIDRKHQQIKDELVENKSFFQISATLINSGRLNTSIKKPALFRVYIGRENYIDLKLTLNDFENKSEIAPNSTVVATLASTDISQLPQEDRKLINTYWGQSVQCKLFVEDVHGEATVSNSIAFSEGLYQKIIFDRLSVVATSQNM